MKKVFLFLFLFLVMVSGVKAVAPVGNVDSVDNGVIYGWALDSDLDGPIPVHIYVDGKLLEDVLANIPREVGVGVHGFSYKYAPLGYGNHKVEVYAIGVNSNNGADGQNTLLNVKYINTGCNGLVADENEWCRNNNNYWVNRQRDTTYLWNQHIRIGINNSYGGLISQLYSNDRSFNLIEEHGGSAVQISLYGYDLTKGNGGYYFVSDGSICTKYNSQAECQNANGGKACAPRGAANGDHVANCSSVRTCNGVDAGWPFNPIQAQAIGCAWEHASNDVSYSASCGANCWETTLNNPANYSKSTSFNGMVINQKVSLVDVYAKVDYKITYSGPYTLSEHGQEIPAFFTNAGVDKTYQFYNGNSPGNLNSPVTDVALDVGDRTLAFPSYNQGAQPYDRSKEYWMGVCNQDSSKCVTIASFSPEVKQVTMKKMADTGSYIGPIGFFNIYPGMNKNITLYIFPYKYNAVINGKSIRQRILELAVANGIQIVAPIAVPTVVPTQPPLPTVNIPQPTAPPKPTSIKISGDYDGNGVVNLADFGIWKGKYLAVPPTMTLADFGVWKRAYLTSN